ncbi:dCTP deaminase [Nocardiopsis synnemataformans]|uniref:dCTP deaminase n=1 Tax=Nocardiopsis synnemataformans TaxID=61305 RepID=UPI003EC03BF2
MILTGPAIRAAVANGTIHIDPYRSEQVSANAYDWRLGAELRRCAPVLDAAHPTAYTPVPLPAEGVVLEPGVLYLGRTLEYTASETYAQRLYGSQDSGALGIWVHISAPLGHQGHAIAWTLEIRVVHPVRVYPGMPLGKLTFHSTLGQAVSYQRLGRKYRSTRGIDTSRLFEELTP